MFIIKTIHGDVKVDHDELALIASAKDTIVFLRNGGVNPKHISIIVPDVDRIKSVVRRPGESDESINNRIMSDRSPDVFEFLRKTPRLGAIRNLQLPL